MHCRCLAGRYGQVIVGIDTDNKVNNDKGSNRPYFSVEEREKNLLSLKYPLDSLNYKLVDKVVFFSTNEFLKSIIESIKPDFIIKGLDWFGHVVGSDVGEVIYFDKQNEISSTMIEQRILSKNKTKSNFDPTI